MMIVDYIKAKECRNADAWFTCLKCGACGRRFDAGYMVDDGGTHVEEDEE